MSETLRRVIEIDAKLGAGALAEVRALQKEMKALEDAAPKVGAGVKKAAKEVHEAGNAFSHLKLNTTGARRELLVLAHELSQGNYKQFAGSLLVMAEQIDATRLIFSKLGLAAIATVGAIAGVTIAVVAGALEQKHFNNSLILTGNIAGATSSTLSELARSIESSTKATIGTSREVVAQVVASGRFGPQLIEPVARAIIRLSQVSGEETGKVVGDFGKMSDGVLKWATEANKQYNFLNLSQRDVIRALEETGRVSDAQIAVLTRLTDHLGTDHVKNLGTAEKAWIGFKKAISGTVDSLKSVGREADMATKIAAARANISRLENEMTAEARFPAAEFTRAQEKSREGARGFRNPTGIGLPSVDESRVRASPADMKLAELERAREDFAALLATQTSEVLNAITLANTAIINRVQGEADTLIRELTKKIRSGGHYEDLVKEARAAIAELRKGGRTEEQIFGKSVDENMFFAALKKHFGSELENELQNAFKTSWRALNEESAALKEQIEQYKDLGKAAKGTTLAKLEAAMAEGGKLSRASPEVKSDLRAVAVTIGEDKEALSQLKATAEVKKHVEALESQVEAKAMNARETKIAAEMARLESSELKKSSETYAEYKDRLRAAVIAQHDNLLARKLLADEAAASDEAKRLNQETALIGLNSLERAKATAVLRIQIDAEKELVDNPNAGAAIAESARKKTDILTAALERNYEAQRKFETGAAEAFARYNEEATNSAKFSEAFISGGIQQINTAFEGMFRTGKINASGFFQYIKDEFIKAAANMTTQKIFGDKGVQGFITDGLKTITDTLGFTSATDVAKQSAKASEVSAIQSTTTQLGWFSTEVQGNTTGLRLLSTAANDASLALARISSSKSASEFSGAFKGVGGGSGTDTGSGSTDGWVPTLYEAKGGIVGPHGVVPLRTYARGGIANSPQMAVFGEGSRNEAFIPLPDNRSVPVTLSGGGGAGGGTIVNIYNNGSGDDVRQEQKTDASGQKQIDVYITKKVRDTFSKDISSGGGMARMLEGQYGLNRAAGAAR